MLNGIDVVPVMMVMIVVVTRLSVMRRFSVQSTLIFFGSCSHPAVSLKTPTASVLCPVLGPTRGIEAQRASAPTMPGTADRTDRRSLRTHAPYNLFGSPASEQSAHHAADQAARTATTAMMVSTTPVAATW